MQEISDIEIYIGFTALITGLLIGVVIVFYTLRTGAPPMPSSPVMRRTLRMVLPKNPQGDVVELGSGWGGLTQQLGEAYPNHTIIGLELSPLPWLISRLRSLLVGARHVQYLRCDFRVHPIDRAGLIVCYLNPEVMQKIEPWLWQGVAKGSWIVCIGFALPGHQAIKQVHVPDIHASQIFLYQR
ncbi:class I SAM-dependent methyltransferase [Magnetococcus sp. PR-3]|uniref:class I SAM-dependent methyltransferase n=1 Tax=Magnetococcus sp. PR-3 TaxID=3120355 RepID=UPI002FCE258F